MKKTPEQMRRELADHPFKRDSKVQDVHYHGTMHENAPMTTLDDGGIRKFQRSMRGMHFATPDKGFANGFAYAGDTNVIAPAAVYPVHVHATNPFDYENPEHVHNLVKEMNRVDPNVDLTDTKRRASQGDWSILEHKNAVNAAKRLGHDAMHIFEGGAKNIGVFNPNQLKSAIGNNGNYDMNDPDITKANGGPISTEQMRRELNKNKFLEKSHVKVPVYHGTDSSFRKFSDAHRGMATGATSSKAGHFFTDSPDTAAAYAHNAALDAPVQRLLKEADEYADSEWDKHDQKIDEAERLEKYLDDPKNRNRGQNIIAAYLRMENPYIHDAKGDTPTGIGGINPLIDHAKKHGHDSVIIKNFDDKPRHYSDNATHYIVFHPNQIKSSIGNNGDYDVNNPDITKAKGGTISADMKQGAGHDTAQEGAFYRVRPRHIKKGLARPAGLLEGSGQDTTPAEGSPRSTHAEPYSDEQIQNLIKSGQTFAHQAAQNYNQKYLGYPHQPIPNLTSSFHKQNPIGKTFELAATGHPEYKKRIYAAYKHHLPEHVGDAKDYDELLDKAYHKLGEETHAQFNSLPVNMSFHKNGEGNYSSSKQMANDVHNNRHLYVYQGGDPHEHLNKIDPETGLSQNDMFRAVHDFYGHAMNGSQFGPHGEEKAWAEHSGMFSPLARAALTSETRGQNSMVNYTGLNAELKKAVAAQRDAQAEAHRRGMKEQAEKHGQNIKDLMAHFKYAPQKSVLLPPEMISGQYNGQVPHYLRDMIQPDEHMKKGGVVSHHTNEVHGMKASEALGNHEGKTLMVTQADRTKVGDGYLGGPGFSSLQLDHPEYEGKAWGVKNASTAKTITNANKRVPKGQAIWSTMIGTPKQHSSNQMVFDKLVQDFKQRLKLGQIDPALLQKINEKMALARDNNKNPVFDEGADISRRGFVNNADTFDKRRVIADLLGGKGVGGKKGQVGNYDKIIHDTTEPILRGAPTLSVGHRLFNLNGETSHRPDLHPAFPQMLHGEDHGVSFEPVPNHLMLHDYHDDYQKRKGKKAGVMAMTRGYAPSQFLSDEFLTHLQKHGFKKGGKVAKKEK